MKRALLSLSSIILASCLLTACTTAERQDAAMIGGGVAGGVAGSYLTDGSPLGAIAGAVGGGYVGRKLAQ